MTITLPGADDVPEWRRRTKGSLAEELARTKWEADGARAQLERAHREADVVAAMHNRLTSAIRKYQAWLESEGMLQAWDVFDQFLTNEPPVDVQPRKTAMRGGL